ncbi:hypothetical protein AMTRI_Chr13g85070 [Amborella trichopoda]
MAATLPAWFLSLLFCCILSRGYDVNPYKECAPVNCSGINIQFPFSAASSPELCGLFKIDCGGLSSPTTIKFLDKSYDVKNRSYPERTINITAPLSDFFDNGNCIFFLHKISLPDHIEGFHLPSSYVNISIFYNCDNHSLLSNQETIWALKGCEKNQEIYCTDKQEIVNNLTPPSACSWIQYPVLESSLKAMKHGNGSWTLQELSKEGIALQWEQFPSECSNCTSSGGRCALNATDRRTTACYCKDKEACDSGILLLLISFLSMFGFFHSSFIIFFKKFVVTYIVLWLLSSYIALGFCEIDHILDFLSASSLVNFIKPNLKILISIIHSYK